MRVVRVALHRPVERHSSRDRAWSTKAGLSGEIRCEIRLAPKQVWTLWGRAEKPTRWKGGYWGGQFTPRGTTYVFVNVVVAPRYVARLRLGSGGLKLSRTRYKRGTPKGTGHCLHGVHSNVMGFRDMCPRPAETPRPRSKCSKCSKMAPDSVLPSLPWLLFFFLSFGVA